MAGTVAELKNMFGEMSDDIGRNVGTLWSKWSQQRQEKVKEWVELRDYVFATDTTTTTAGELGWKNSTTLPKLCQIRDNLHANYISALFPNDNWLRWQGQDEESHLKGKVIESYMRDKAHQGKLRDMISAALYDFIDTGNCFGTSEYVVDRSRLPNGLDVTHYEGPMGRRISPYDIVFNPLAPTFREAPKIIRSIKSIGEIMELAEQDERWRMGVDKALKMRAAAGDYGVDDWYKAIGFSVDGFGDMREYYESQYVEVLTFKGSYFDANTGQTYANQEIIVIDRSITVYNGENESWVGEGDVVHAGWRKRPDNLYAMGPLDNLVGMQYRIDHLENLKADALDLMVHPPLIIKGDVEPFVWGPEEEIHIIGEGSVEEAGKNFSGVASADNQIQILEVKMEEYAGAPKQAMGIRTPGEKTAFEVGELGQAAGRIFQEKITHFEVMFLEPLLNMMFAQARAKFDTEGPQPMLFQHPELNLDVWQDIEASDLSGTGKLRPIGARHFGEQAKLLQDLNQLFSGPLGQMIMPHWSPENTAKLIEDSMQLDRYELVRPNVAVEEQAETAVKSNQLQSVVQEQAQAPS